jgi:hypothetical protein
MTKIAKSISDVPRFKKANVIIYKCLMVNISFFQFSNLPLSAKKVIDYIYPAKETAYYGPED